AGQIQLAAEISHLSANCLGNGLACCGLRRERARLELIILALLLRHPSLSFGARCCRPAGTRFQSGARFDRPLSLTHACPASREHLPHLRQPIKPDFTSRKLTHSGNPQGRQCAHKHATWTYEKHIGWTGGKLSFLVV